MKFVNSSSKLPGLPEWAFQVSVTRMIGLISILLFPLSLLGDKRTCTWSWQAPLQCFQKNIQRHITEQKLPFNILKEERLGCQEKELG